MLGRTDETSYRKQESSSAGDKKTSKRERKKHLRLLVCDLGFVPTPPLPSPNPFLACNSKENLLHRSTHKRQKRGFCSLSLSQYTTRTTLTIDVRRRTRRKKKTYPARRAVSLIRYLLLYSLFPFLYSSHVRHKQTNNSLVERLFTSLLFSYGKTFGVKQSRAADADQLCVCVCVPVRLRRHRERRNDALHMSRHAGESAEPPHRD